MMPHTVSAIVIARDEEHNLAGCLESLHWADERIVVVDEASRDSTESIARRGADVVLLHAFDSFAAQRNRALDAASCRWVLALDADERTTPDLAREIRRAMSSPVPGIAGYRIPIRSRILGRRFRASGTQLDRPLRLFQREMGRWQGDVHETVDLKGGIGELQHHIDHRTLETMSVFLKKIEFYTTLEARRWNEMGRRPRAFDLTLRPLATFLRLYLARGGFRDGPEGFLFCALSAASVAARNWKLRELYQGSVMSPRLAASLREPVEVTR
jgi:glycosyltransferase involved in cell wall biosynthesis